VDDLVQFLRTQLDDDERKIAAMERESHRVKTAPIFQSYPTDWLTGVDIFVSPKRWRDEVEAKRKLIDAVLDYEATIDGEWGCCHSAEQIAAGRCGETSPDEIDALRLLAQPYADRPGWREEWRAAPPA